MIISGKLVKSKKKTSNQVKSTLKKLLLLGTRSFEKI
jgi:hypothetical protein